MEADTDAGGDGTDREEVLQLIDCLRRGMLGVIADKAGG